MLRNYQMGLASLLAAISFSSGAQAETIEPVQQPLSVMNCLMTPWRTVDVSASVAGILEKVAVDRGDVVEEGQLLASLQQDVEKAKLELAQTRLNFAQRKLNRLKELRSKNFVSEQEVDQLKTEMQVVRLETAEAREHLRLRSIKSPIDGVVTLRHLDEGELTKDTPVVTLVQLDPLRVEILLEASQLPYIETGMQAQISPHAPASGTYPAKVIAVDRVIDAASGTFGAVLELPNKGKKLPAGLSCEVSFEKMIEN